MITVKPDQYQVLDHDGSLLCTCHTLKMANKIAESLNTLEAAPAIYGDQAREIINQQY